MLDLDHDRCRRTDGRKWRCYQSVVPNQKYCEKHMHRGRGGKRSRKLVEDFTLDKPSVTENLSKKPKSIPGYEIPAIVSKTLQPFSGPSRAVIKCPDFANASAKMIEKTVTNIEGNLNKVVDEKIAAVNLASGLTFSPRSVLQDGQRCLETNRHVKASWEVPRRCGRTDGRKWQCQNKALLTQKYCALHINRGQKKAVMSLLPSGEAKAALVTSSATKLSSLQPEMGLHLDTDLTISLPIVLPHSGPKVRDSSSDRISSRDPSIETTNSDDCADTPNLIDVSP